MSRPREDTLGARVAGGLLVASAVLTLAVALADLAIGVSLVAGRGWRKSAP